MQNSAIPVVMLEALEPRRFLSASGASTFSPTGFAGSFTGTIKLKRKDTIQGITGSGARHQMVDLAINVSSADASGLLTGTIALGTTGLSTFTGVAVGKHFTIVFDGPTGAGTIVGKARLNGGELKATFSDFSSAGAGNAKGSIDVFHSSAGASNASASASGAPAGANVTHFAKVPSDYSGVLNFNHLPASLGIGSKKTASVVMTISSVGANGEVSGQLTSASLGTQSVSGVVTTGGKLTLIIDPPSLVGVVTGTFQAKDAGFSGSMTVLANGARGDATVDLARGDNGLPASSVARNIQLQFAELQALLSSGMSMNQALALSNFAGDVAGSDIALMGLASASQDATAIALANQLLNNTPTPMFGTNILNETGLLSTDFALM